MSIRTLWTCPFWFALLLLGSLSVRADPLASAAKHWAYQTPRRPALPEVHDRRWPKTPIDCFVLARLEKEGLRPSAPPARETLIRRVTLDLTGLPPTLVEVDEFLGDRSPDAYEKLVDRLLASPEYGEQMASEWLDEARFADSNGYQNDFHRTMWPWRDWVIQAFNRNLSYDQFVTAQLAGDLLPNATRQERIATGFSRNNRTVTEAGSIDEEWRVENTVDRVETVSQVFLGLTLGCARCHDHKFDPISQKEFYQFYAFFNNVNEQGVYTETRGNVPPMISLPSAKQKEQLGEFEAAIATAERAVKEKEAALPAAQKAWEEAQLAKSIPAEPPGQLLRYPLDGKLKSEGVTNSLIFQGEGQPAFVQAPFGQAIQLDGKAKSFLLAGDTAGFERTNAFSYGAWINANGSGTVLSRMDEATNFRGYDLLLLPDQRVAVHLVHRWETNAIRVITTNRVARSVWTHVLVSYDGSGKAKGVQVYLDGKQAKLEITHDTLTGAITSTQPLRIGRRSETLPFEGALADVRLYERALTEPEAAALVDHSLRPILELKPGQRLKEPAQALAEFFRAKFAAEFRQTEENLASTRSRKQEFEKQIPTVMVMEDRKEPRPTFVLKRGQYDQPEKDKQVEPGVPAILSPFPADAPRNRLGLAKWLVVRDNPLTARVAVSRYWQHYFGIGLVKTSENFGVQGEAPSHPELLDWLATEFIRMGWDVKAIQKLIVMSATYQQSSAASRELFEKDPENRLLARGPRFRMLAEMVRDNALSVAGLLVEKTGGPSIKPYQPEGLWTELAGGANEGPYHIDKGPELYRRSLYIFRKRTVPPPTMTSFDAPSREICQVKRQRTNTPLQALALLNDATYVEAARGLAESMLKEGGADPAARLCYGFRRVTARRPQPRELQVLVNGLERYRRIYEKDPDAAKKFIGRGERPPGARLAGPDVAAYTAVASIILNLDETITKE